MGTNSYDFFIDCLINSEKTEQIRWIWTIMKYSVQEDHELSPTIEGWGFEPEDEKVLREYFPY